MDFTHAGGTHHRSSVHAVPSSDLEKSQYGAAMEGSTACRITMHRFSALKQKGSTWVDGRKKRLGERGGGALTTRSIGHEKRLEDGGQESTLTCSACSNSSVKAS